jgi:hypothetical protein
MGSKADWKRVFTKFRKPWVMTAGGFALGALGAAIFVLVLHFVIQPQMSLERRDIYSVAGDRFTVWYHDGSSQRAGYVGLYARLDESLDDLLARLDIDPSAVPSSIDVLVHDDPEQLQASIVQRKSPMATHTFYAVLDLLAGEDPYPRLAELVLAFGWGECVSQLLYSGALTVLLSPDRNHHCPVAAAPPRLRYSFEDLLRLEATGEFPQTLYQRFDSPFSPSMALGSLESIATFYSLFGTEGALVPEEDFASLHAASLVAYLIDCNGGLGALKSVWGPGSSVAVFERLVCEPLDELGDSWWKAATEGGLAGPTYGYYHALYLFESGEFEEAYRLTRPWRERELSEEDLILGVRCALSAGEFKEAAAWVEGTGSDSGRVAEWIALFDEWSRVEEDEISVFGGRSAEELTRLLTEVREAREQIAAGLGLTSNQLPQRMTVFFYEDAEACQTGRSLTPDVETHQAAWHAAAGDDIDWILARTLPAYAFRASTASNLLRTGLATALTFDRETLIAEGCEILEVGNWTPLWQLGFGGLPQDRFRVQTGLMIRQVMDAHGPGVLRELWRATARLGGAMSFDSALLEYAGTSRREIEQTLLNSLLVCD